MGSAPNDHGVGRATVANCTKSEVKRTSKYSSSYFAGRVPGPGVKVSDMVNPLTVTTRVGGAGAAPPAPTVIRRSLVGALVPFAFFDLTRAKYVPSGSEVVNVVAAVGVVVSEVSLAAGAVPMSTT